MAERTAREIGVRNGETGKKPWFRTDYGGKLRRGGG